ncbi:putative protein-serine/threonine phosphatase [Helianthus anomalus]
MTILPFPLKDQTTRTIQASLLDVYSYNTIDKASTFESSTSFSSTALQPQPRNSINSGPLNGFSGGLLRKGSLIRVIRRAISKTFNGQNSSVAPMKNVTNFKDHDWMIERNNELTVSSVNLSSEGSLFDEDGACLNGNKSQNLQWAQGKAGEDRVHVVVSEENGWVLLGFMTGLTELKGLLWDDDQVDSSDSVKQSLDDADSLIDNGMKKNRLLRYVHQQESYPCVSGDVEVKTKGRVRNRSVAKKWEENQRRWKCEFYRERSELNRRLREYMNSNGSKSVNHSDVLKALAQGLKKTEEAYLDTADQMLVENPELALMGSCVLVKLMKGEYVYVMDVGDSRAVLAQKPEPDIWRQDLEKIHEETWYDLEV